MGEEQSNKKVIVIYDQIIPLLGSRGGKIKIGLNAKNAAINYTKMPSFAFDKRIKNHFLKFIPSALNQRASLADFRLVKIIRLMTSRHKIMDDDNVVVYSNPTSQILQPQPQIE